MAGRIVSCFAGADADRKLGCFYAEQCETDEDIAAELLRERGWEARESKRARLVSRWTGRGQKSSNPIRPGTVNRELDTLRSMLAKAVEWGYLLGSPALKVKRLRLDNRRTRILSTDEQRGLLEGCPRKFRALVLMALITGARIGELLALRWEDTADGYLTFCKTKNGKVRRVEVTRSLQAVLHELPKAAPWVFANRQTGKRHTVGGARKVFMAAAERAGLGPDVTLHTLRHTALSRMIAVGYDDYTGMAISGHGSTRMLARYTHPTATRRQGALETFAADLRGQDVGSTAPEPGDIAKKPPGITQDSGGTIACAGSGQRSVSAVTRSTGVSRSAGLAFRFRSICSAYSMPYTASRSPCWSAVATMSPSRTSCWTAEMLSNPPTSTWPARPAALSAATAPRAMLSFAQSTAFTSGCSLTMAETTWFARSASH